MKKNQITLKLPNGIEASLLVPDVNENQALSIVDTNVLRKIIQFLPKETFQETKNILIEEIREKNNIDDLCMLLIDEINFHKSVNMIQSFFVKEE